MVSTQFLPSLTDIIINPGQRPDTSFKPVTIPVTVFPEALFNNLIYTPGSLSESTVRKRERERERESTVGHSTLAPSKRLVATWSSSVGGRVLRQT